MSRYPHGIPERGLKPVVAVVAGSSASYPHGIPERGLKLQLQINCGCKFRYPHGIPERGLKHEVVTVHFDIEVIPMESPKGD